MKVLVFLMLFASLTITNSFAQTSFDGNSLASYIGKSATGAEMKDLKANYHCEFELSTYIISCWFESGALHQVGIAAK